MELNLLYIAIGLVGLYLGGEWLVTGASRTALAYKISPLIIGLTIVSVGTSTPELFVSVISAFQGKPGIALGNVIGSNIANIGLILGFTGVLRVLTVHDMLVKREIPIMIIVSLFATMLSLDGELNRLDGLLLLFGFAVFTYLFIELAKHEPDGITEENPADKGKKPISIPLELLRIGVGIVALALGAQFLVEGASAIALSLGVSELVVGVTVVAVGTSLPELSASITAALKGESDIAIGNVVGSNIANLLLILGATATINTIDVGSTDLSIVEYVVMIGFAFLLLPFARNRRLARVESAVLLGTYFAFVVYSFAFSGN